MAQPPKPKTTSQLQHTALSSTTPASAPHQTIITTINNNNNSSNATTTAAPQTSVSVVPERTRAPPTRLFGVTLPSASSLPRGSGPFGSSQHASFRAPPPNPSFCRYTAPLSTDTVRVVKIAPRPRPPTMYRTPVYSAAVSAPVPMPIAPPRIRPTFPTFAPQPPKTFNPVIRVLNRPNTTPVASAAAHNVTAMSSQAAKTSQPIYNNGQPNMSSGQQIVSACVILPAPVQTKLRPIHHVPVQHQVDRGPLTNPPSVPTSHYMASSAPRTVTQYAKTTTVPMSRITAQPAEQVSAPVPLPTASERNSTQPTPTSAHRTVPKAPVPMAHSNLQYSSTFRQKQHQESNELPAQSNIVRSQTPQPSTANTHPVQLPQPSEGDGSPTREELMTRLDDVARALRSLWIPPPNQQQVDTLMLHRLRALFAIDPTVSRSRVARECSVRKQSISLYLRGMFRGKQDLLERKIASLIVAYFEPGAVADRAEKRRADFAKHESVPVGVTETATALETAAVEDTENEDRVATEDTESGERAVIDDTEKAVENEKSMPDSEDAKVTASTAKDSTQGPNATVSLTATPPPRPLSLKASLMKNDIEYHTKRGTLYANDGPTGDMGRATIRMTEKKDVKVSKVPEPEKRETRAIAAKRKQMAEEASRVTRRSVRHLRSSELPLSKRLRR